MTPAQKQKFPRADALKVAAELCREMKPVCVPDRLVVAGSLRRGRDLVSDVEIVFVSKYQTVPEGLFDTVDDYEAFRVIDGLVVRGVLEKRKNSKGSETWGVKNMLARHFASGIPVDLFAATESAWWNCLVVRTGPAESNIAIAVAAKEKGWRWEAGGSGFVNDAGVNVPVRCEADAFELVGLTYRPPHERWKNGLRR